LSDTDEKIKEYGYVNFKAAEENWSEYELSDKTIIRIKVVPLKFFKKDKNIPVNSTVLMVTFSPPELRGDPSAIPMPTTPAEAEKALNEIDMKFDTLKEPWNEYELDDVKLFLKTVVTSVSSTKLYDLQGDPIYLVSHQILTKRHPPV
jgi:hypothetical protein